MPPRHKAIQGCFQLCFSTSKFDIESEPPNDINPIPGRSVLVWLTPLLVRAGYRVSEPWTEDFGWSMDAVDPSGRRFLLGASTRPDAGGVVDWTLNLSRWRTPLEWLRREPLLARGDPFLERIEAAVAGPEFSDQDLVQPTCMGFWESFGDLLGRSR